MRFFSLILFIPSFCFGQDNHLEIKLKKKWADICIESKNDLICETLSSWNKNEYDSCYVYSSRGLLKKNITLEEKDFFLYVLGYSSYNKNMFSKALKNFSLISEDKDYELEKLSKIGAVFLNQGEYDKAILNFEKYLSKTGFRGKGVYHNLGLCYLYKKEYKKAEKHFEKYLSNVDKTDSLLIINIKNDLANIYYNQYMDSKAIPLFKEAYDLANLYTDMDFKRITSRNMAIVEKNRKNFKKSLKYFEEYDKWKDSIWNRDKIWELTEKDKEIAVAQKQQEIVVQEAQIKRQKTIQKGLLLGASGLLIFIGGLAYFYQKLKKQKRLISEQKEELDVANKTKNYLFSVVSHDLRSPINTIKRQHKKLAKHIANNDLSAIKEANQQAISVTDSTSHLLNNVLQWSLEQSNQLNFSQEEYALQPIIEHILFDYEELAESNEISITTNFEDDVVIKVDKESLKIVLRNLIDNSVKYMNGAGSIAISTKKQDNLALIEIKDSGIGISAEKLQKINALKDLSVDKIDRSKGIGLGLILCQTLIKKNNGTLFFESEEGKSTTAIITLSLA